MSRRVIFEIHQEATVDSSLLEELLSYIEHSLGAAVSLKPFTEIRSEPLWLIFEGDWKGNPSMPERRMLREKMLQLNFTPSTTSLGGSMPSGYGIMARNGTNIRIVGAEIRDNAAGGIYVDNLESSTISGNRISDSRNGSAPSQAIRVGRLEDSAIEGNEIYGFQKAIDVDAAIRSPIRQNRLLAPGFDVQAFEQALRSIEASIQTISDDNERELGELHLRHIERAIEQGSSVEGALARLITWTGTAGGLVTSGAVLWNGVKALGQALGVEVPPAPEGLGQ